MDFTQKIRLQTDFMEALERQIGEFNAFLVNVKVQYVEAGICYALANLLYPDPNNKKGKTTMKQVVQDMFGYIADQKNLLKEDFLLPVLLEAAKPFR